MGRGALLAICITTIVGLLFLVTQIDFDLSDARVQQGAIAATVVISGWLVAFIFREAGEIFDRARKSRDLQKALLAEIHDYSVTLRVEDPGAWRTKMSADVLGGGDEPKTAFHPFFARVSEPVIFTSLAREVLLLPPSTIDSVIQFYSTLSDLRLFIQDVAEDSFRALSAERRLIGYIDLMVLQNTTADIADDAILRLRLSLDGIPEWMVGPNGTH